jgi:5-formaminoimidazole-4-carboxamide-1-beta-D-ribofuranosyl 5'-monophosphate synthetase
MKKDAKDERPLYITQKKETCTDKKSCTQTKSWGQKEMYRNMFVSLYILSVRLNIAIFAKLIKTRVIRNLSKILL